MTHSCSVITAAAGRDWHFLLTVGQWMKLQQAFGGGPNKVSERLAGDAWTIEDVREVIERGLEGGGQDAAASRNAATEIMNGQPLLKSYELAGDILGAGFAGMEELTKKKAIARAMEAAVQSMTATANGGSATSSAPASSPASSHRKPSGLRSGNISP